MAQLLILAGTITLFLFVVLTIRVCLYAFGRVRPRKTQASKSRYARLMCKVKHTYLYCWWIAAAGIGGAVYLITLVEPSTPSLREALAALLIGTSLVTSIGLVRGEILLARANLVRGGREMPGSRSLSENSGPALR